MMTLQTESPLVLTCLSKYCNQCSFAASEMGVLSRAQPKVRYLTVDIEDHPYIVDDLKIDAVPTYCIFVNRKEVFRVTGRMNTAGIQSLFDALNTYAQFPLDRVEESENQMKNFKFFPLEPYGVVEDWDLNRKTQLIRTIAHSIGAGIRFSQKTSYFLKHKFKPNRKKNDKEPCFSQKVARTSSRTESEGGGLREAACSSAGRIRILCTRQYLLRLNSRTETECLGAKTT